MKNITKGKINLLVARFFSGLNINGMKFLLPLWISPLSCVSLRLLFGTLVLWIIGIFEKPDMSSVADRVKLFFIGAFVVFGYMSLYAVGLSMTTPVNLAIFNAMQPIWVLVLSMLFMGEKVIRSKVFGILAGLSGAFLCILSQPDDDIASNPILGNIMGILCSIFNAVYLLLSSRILKRVANMTMLRYTFLGALSSSLIVTIFAGFHAPVLSTPSYTAVGVLVFVLIFPTVVSYLLTPIGLKYLSPTTVSVFGYFTLFVATVVSVIMGTDRLDLMQIVALCLISLSIYNVSISEK